MSHGMQRSNIYGERIWMCYEDGYVPPAKKTAWTPKYGIVWTRVVLGCGPLYYHIKVELRDTLDGLVAWRAQEYPYSGESPANWRKIVLMKMTKVLRDEGMLAANMKLGKVIGETGYGAVGGF